MDGEFIYQKILLALKLACQNQDVQKHEEKWASTGRLDAHLTKSLFVLLVGFHGVQWDT